MADIFSTALSGLNASRLRASTAANNLANVNTPGFRAQRVNSSSLPSGQGSTTTSVSVSQSVRNLRQTGNPLDLAVGGNGFIPLVDNVGQQAFTRNGSFSRNADGTLVNSQGFQLAADINVPADTSNLNIGEDGTVTARLADGTNANLGQIELASFSNPDGLSQEGNSISRQTGASGVPQIGPPGTEGRGVILSGFLESSNVNIVRETVNLLNEENMTQANAAVVRTADEMQQAALDIKA